MSADGRVVAAGDLETCVVRVFAYESTTAEWRPIGSDDGISCQNSFIPGDGSTAVSMSLSEDGNILAVGAPGNYASYDQGSVRIYRYDASVAIASMRWIQLGQNLTLDSDRDRYGTAVSLSDDGLTVAIAGHRVMGFTLATFSPIPRMAWPKFIVGMLTMNDGSKLVKTYWGWSSLTGLGPACRCQAMGL